MEGGRKVGRKGGRGRERERVRGREREGGKNGKRRYDNNSHMLVPQHETHNHNKSITFLSIWPERGTYKALVVHTSCTCSVMKNISNSAGQQLCR